MFAINAIIAVTRKYLKPHIPANNKPVSKGPIAATTASGNT